MRRLRFLHTWIAIGLASFLATVGAGAVAATREVLPDAVTPTHYDLALSPDAETLTFRGTVAITVDVKSSVRVIVVNADGLDFDHATIDGGTSVTVTADPKLGRETLHAEDLIAPGRHVVTIQYHGK